MNNFFYAFIIILSNNIDNIGIRVAYSLKGIKIDISKNIFISIITLFISIITSFLGNKLSSVINISTCKFIIFFLFIGIGIFFFIKNHLEKKDNNNYLDIIINPKQADINDSKTIDLKEAFFLGLALNLDNISGGFSSGLLGFNFYFIGVLSALISLLTLWLGNYLFPIFRRFKLDKKFNIIGGIIFIIIGIKQLI